MLSEEIESYKAYRASTLASLSPPELLVHFRQRISPNLINKVNERTVKKMREITERQNRKKKGFGRQK
jgi:hypothetical protein